MAVFSPAFAATKAEKAFGFRSNRVYLTKAWVTNYKLQVQGGGWFSLQIRSI
jgi:hypothetical protein